MQTSPMTPGDIKPRDRASFRWNEVPISVTGGAIIAQNLIDPLPVKGSNADVLATIWTLAIPLVCLVGIVKAFVTANACALLEDTLTARF